MTLVLIGKQVHLPTPYRSSMRGDREHSPPATGQCYAFNIEDVRHSFVVITFAAAQVQSRAVVAVHMSLVQKNIHRGHLVDMQLMPFKISVLRRNSELLNTSGTQNCNLLFIVYWETYYRPKQHTQGGPCWHVLCVL